MRLGKTAMLICAADKIEAKNILVVCRAVARANWANEFSIWSKRNWVVHPLYSNGASTLVFSETRPTVYITSYELLADVLTRLGTQRFDLACVDEIHYAKNINAARTRAVFSKEGLPSKAARIWGASGTICPNNAAEMWAFLFVFGATKLSYWDFAKKFCIVEDTGYGTIIKGTKTDRKTLSELHEIMKPKFLRKTAEEVSMQLPKISCSTVALKPGKVDLAVTSMWKFAIPHDKSAELNLILEKELGIVNAVLKDGKVSDELLETLKGMAKSISTLRKYTALQKLDPACELIANELENGAYRKCVIFAHHRDCILGAMQRLHKFYPVSMYGGTAPARLENNLRRFQDPKNKCRVFIGQINAAGTSISLDAANHIFFLEESFVPGDNMQAAQRCGGVRQKAPIFIRTFCLENSIDQRIQMILMRKMNEIAKILGPLSPQPQTLEELF